MDKVEALESGHSLVQRADIPASSVPALCGDRSSPLALCLLLFLHCAVPVLNWLSWQLASP